MDICSLSLGQLHPPPVLNTYLLCLSEGHHHQPSTQTRRYKAALRLPLPPSHYSRPQYLQGTGSRSPSGTQIQGCPSLSYKTAQDLNINCAHPPMHYGSSDHSRYQTQWKCYINSHLWQIQGCFLELSGIPLLPSKSSIDC